MPTINSIPNQQFIPTGMARAEVKSVLNVVFDDTTTTKKKVVVVPGWEYRIIFYDPYTNKKVDCIALVEEVFDYQIRILVKADMKKKNCSRCSNKNCVNRDLNTTTVVNGPIHTCDCFLSNSTNVDSNKYSSPVMYYVPINNIMKIEYIKKEQPKKKERGTKVVLLGISAKMLRALILHLEFFDDQVENAVKYVDIKVGNRYNFVYETGGRRPTTYEIEGKVLSIEEVRENNCKTDKRYVREVGSNNNVYECCNPADTSKEEFLKGVPVKAVKIVIDSSTAFESHVHTLMLDTIRDCTLIESEDENAGIVIDPCDGCVNETCDCDPETCEYCNGTTGNNPCISKPKIFTYEIGDNVIVKTTGEKAKIYIKGEEPQYIPMEEILKFYIGDATGEETHF